MHSIGEHVLVVWSICALLNVYSVSYNAARSKDYELFVHCIVLGIFLAPLMTIIGFATALGDLDNKFFKEKKENGSQRKKS